MLPHHLIRKTANTTRVASPGWNPSGNGGFDSPNWPDLPAPKSPWEVSVNGQLLPPEADVVFRATEFGDEPGSATAAGQHGPTPPPAPWSANDQRMERLIGSMEQRVLGGGTDPRLAYKQLKGQDRIDKIGRRMGETQGRIDSAQHGGQPQNEAQARARLGRLSGRLEGAQSDLENLPSPEEFAIRQAHRDRQNAFISNMGGAFLRGGHAAGSQAASRGLDAWNQAEAMGMQREQLNSQQEESAVRRLQAFLSTVGQVGQQQREDSQMVPVQGPDGNWYYVQTDDKVWGQQRAMADPRIAAQAQQEHLLEWHKAQAEIEKNRAMATNYGAQAHESGRKAEGLPTSAQAQEEHLARVAKLRAEVGLAGARAQQAVAAAKASGNQNAYAASQVYSREIAAVQDALAREIITADEAAEEIARIEDTMHRNFGYAQQPSGPPMPGHPGLAGAANQARQGHAATIPGRP